MFGIGIGIGIGIKSKKLGAALLLDTYPANYAFSFRKLKTNYAGPCVRIRRSSDNAEQDIGFTANYVNEAAITSFVGASSAFVTTWYDQSGNAANKIKIIASEQPRIVISGTINKQNGFVCMDSISADLGLQNTVTSGGVTSQSFNVFKVAIGGECLPANNIGGLLRFYGVMQPNTSSPTNSSGTPTYYKNSTIIVSPTRQDLQTSFNNVLALLTTDNVDLSGWAISSNKYPGYRGIVGYNMEEIVYFSSSFRAEKETNIKTYYGL